MDEEIVPSRLETDGGRIKSLPARIRNQRSKLPYAQSVVEAPPTSGTGAVSANQSTYGQLSFPIAHHQINGDVGKFAIKTAHASIENLLQTEMTGSVQGMAWYESMMHIWGSAGATSPTWRPQWDGFDRQIGTKNVIAPNGGLGTTLALTDLDNLIDTVRVRIGMPLPDSDFFFLTSQPMISQIGRLIRAQETVFVNTKMAPRRDDGIAGHPVVEVEGGIEVPAYRGIPIVGTNFMTPSFGQMGTVTPSAAGSGSQLGAATYFYGIEYVTLYGRGYCSAAVSPAATAGQNVTLTFATPTPTDYLGNALPILQYKVYAGASATTMTLRGIVGGTDDQDNAVTSIQDTGAALNANARSTAPGVIFGATNGVTPANAGDGATSPITGALIPSAGYVEDLFLVTRNPDFVAVPTVTEVESEILAPVNARSVQYALVADKCLAMRASAFAAKLLGAKTV